MTTPASDAEPADDDRLARLTGLLRDLRARLTDPVTADPDRWELDLYAYDDALVAAADTLDVGVDQAAREEMTPDQRAQLEQRLAEAGLDLGGTLSAGEGR